VSSEEIFKRHRSYTKVEVVITIEEADTSSVRLSVNDEFQMKSSGADVRTAGVAKGRE
jgi:hypothetical protein